MEYLSIYELLDDATIKTQYIELLSYLTNTEDLLLLDFNDKIKKIHNMGLIIVCITRIHDEIKLIGAGTIIIEPKIIHGGKSVGHIEDVIVHPHYRNQGIAQTILNK